MNDYIAKMYKGCHEMKNESSVIVLSSFQQEKYNGEGDMTKISYDTGHSCDS